MSNLFDYLDWRGDLTLEHTPFCAVDGLILSCLAYIRFEGLLERERTVAGAARAFFALPDAERRCRAPEDLRLFRMMARSARFSRMRLHDYVSRLDYAAQEQFAAVAIRTGDGGTCLAFRGTDDTFVGWKEDFNMSFLTTVPSQRRALEYTERIAKETRGPLRLAGHSKGGNIAVYAAAFCSPEVQRRILAVYDNDGPGFGGDVLRSAGYRAVRGRLQSYVPQSSVVGMLFDHEEIYTVVHSTQMGILQHDPYTWEVRGADFIRLKRVTASSRFVDRTLKDWITRMEVPQRAKFFDALYDILNATDAETFSDLGAGWLRNARAILRHYSCVDEETRRVIGKVLFLLLKASTQSLGEMLPLPGRSRTGQRSLEGGKPKQLPPGR